MKAFFHFITDPFTLLAWLMVVYVYRSTWGFLKGLCPRYFRNDFIGKLLIPRLLNRPLNGIWIGKEYLSDDSRVRHSHIVGATGSGKTILIEQLIKADIFRGLGCLIIDPKGDLDLYNKVRSMAFEAGRGQQFACLSTHPKMASHCWNPCLLGNTSERQTKFYNSSIYSEPHYAKHCERGLLLAFKNMDTFEVPTLPKLINALDGLAKTQKVEALEGLFLDLENLRSSEWEPILIPNGTRPEFNMLDLVTSNEILYVSLPTEAKAIQSSRVGRLLLQEMLLISGMRKENPALRGKLPFSIYIDEFDAFATTSFATFINKARSSNFMIQIAHQTISDLNKVDPTFTGQILGNCNIRFIFRQDVPDDAELWARFFGTHTVVKQTMRQTFGRNTGDTSAREVQEFNVSPDVIKELPVGSCVYSSKTPNELKILRVPFLAKAKQGVIVPRLNKFLRDRGLKSVTNRINKERIQYGLRTDSYTRTEATAQAQEG